MALPPDPHDPHGPCSGTGSAHSQLTCKEIIVDLLQQYLDEGTPADITLAIQAHITECPPCVQFVDEYRITREVVQELRYEDIPKEFSARLIEVIRVEMRSTHEG